MNRKRVGIVVEYNPFHHGHQRQINIIKETFPYASIVVVMSGHFSQRGEPTIIDKWTRASHILECGVDLVIELPFYYCVQSANHFAYGAVSVLNHVGIDILCFGSETGDIDYEIMKARLDHQSKQVIPIGMSYPKHMNDLQLKPNDVLGYFYIDAIKTLNPSIEPFIIRRNNEYHDLELKAIASASAIRNGLKLNLDISESTSMSTILSYSNLVYLDDYFEILKLILLTHSQASLSRIKLVSEGIENLLIKQIKAVSTMDELICSCMSKRYTRARIQRTIAQILVSNEHDHLDLDYIRVLGFNSKGQTILNEVKHTSPIPIITAYKPNLSKMLDLDFKATVVYDTIAHGDLINKEYSNIIIKKCS